MESMRNQIVLAVILGMILPWLILLAGTKHLIAKRQTEITFAQDASTLPTVTEVRLDVQLHDTVIRDMELESYIVGVVLAEMPATFHMEALKAQAIVARTYALRRLETRDRHASAAVCVDHECCQAYLTDAEYLAQRGSEEELKKIRQAVEETAGIVITYNGALAEATYFSCSGGRTEDALAVWGEEIPYLQAVDSPGEESAEIFSSSTYFTAEEFSEALGRTLTGRPAQWFGQTSYTAGGGVASMVIGGMLYSGTQLRKLLDLNSTAFVMIPGQQGITVETTGKGHRVGMSQYGAEAMAQTGCSYVQIIGHYYQGVVIDKAENLG